MRKISFYDTLYTDFQSKVGKINYDFHIRNTDYPLVHGHKGYWEFTVLTHGTLYNFIDGEKVICNSPCVFYATTKNEHCLKKTGNNKIRLINLIVKESTIINLVNSFSGNTLDLFHSGNHLYPLSSETVETINGIILKAGLLQTEQFDMRDNLICSATLLILQQIYLRKLDEKDYKDDETNSFYKKLNSIMSDPKFLTYTVNDLCVLLSYSRMQLYRIFKTQFNESPHDYLLNIKFTYAKNLLTSTDMEVKEIAATIGYASVPQFQSTFKKLFNTTPNKYRQTYLKNN